MILTAGPVFPVMASYSRRGVLDLDMVRQYVRHLASHGAQNIMTTAGTSQFNLLTRDEIAAMNCVVAKEFAGRVILGAPALAESLLSEFAADSLHNNSHIALLLNYPERVYDWADVVAFCARMSACIDAPLYVHGLPFRLGGGGQADYSASLVRRILAAAPRVTGMKEECSTYEAGFLLCDAITREHKCEFIVAGGSMRRYLLLHAAGAASFLAGIGSLYPAIDLAFFRYVSAGDLKRATLLVRQLESPVFERFMNIGWHRSLRYAAKSLGLLGDGERAPMKPATRSERRSIDQALKVLHLGIAELTNEGVL